MKDAKVEVLKRALIFSSLDVGELAELSQFTVERWFEPGDFIFWEEDAPDWFYIVAGGRVKARLPKLGRRFSVELWMWNGLPADARPFTGFFFSRAFGGRSSSCVDRLGIGGTFNDSAAKGKLIFCPAKPEENMVAGTSEIPLRTWSHVVLVREDARLRVYLNGNKTPEINTDVQGGQELAGDGVMIGGCDDSKLAFEGRIAKAALFDRSLSPGEIARHYRAGVGHRVAVQLQQKQAKAED